jgi:hypothetical protein
LYYSFLVVLWLWLATICIKYRFHAGGLCQGRFQATVGAGALTISSLKHNWSSGIPPIRYDCGWLSLFGAGFYEYVTLEKKYEEVI